MKHHPLLGGFVRKGPMTAVEFAAYYSIGLGQAKAQIAVMVRAGHIRELSDERFALTESGEQAWFDDVEDQEGEIDHRSPYDDVVQDGPAD